MPQEFIEAWQGEQDKNKSCSTGKKYGKFHMEEYPSLVSDTTALTSVSSSLERPSPTEKLKLISVSELGLG